MRKNSSYSYLKASKCDKSLDFLFIRFFFYLRLRILQILQGI